MKIYFLLNSLFLCCSLMSCGQAPSSSAKKAETIRYIALGDSYTICEGATEKESWPYILAAHLRDANIPVELTANPSRTGWTTQNLIDRELPVMDAKGADFVTVLIGVNDWVQGVDKAVFARNLKTILDHVQQKLKDKTKLILITIPDFSVVPAAAYFNDGRDISKGIAGFNEVIRQEAMSRNLQLVDIFPLTQKMTVAGGLIAADGLHPSVKEYALWEQMILPVALRVLKK